MSNDAARHERSELSVISIRELCKWFPAAGGGWSVVLDDVHLDIRRGECVGIIGPNGAGKSTLLRVIAGVTAPSCGRVARSADIRSLIELGAAVSYDLSGEENARVLATLWCRERRDIGACVRDGLEFAGLGPAATWPVRQYSSGMIARLVFGVATAQPCELLLIDEVLSVGDLDFQSRCRSRLAYLRRQGTTVVLVSHDLDLVGATCDRVLLLRGGQIEEDGAPDDVIRGYLGLPPNEVNRDDALRVRLLGTAPFIAGDVIEFEIESDRAGDLRLELVIEEHPAMVAAGIDAAVVAGWASIDIGRRQVMRMFTTGLPPLRYSLHSELRHEHGRFVGKPCRVVLDGERPELCAARLMCEWSVVRSMAS